MLNLKQKFVLASSALIVAGSASAAPTTPYDDIVAAVDWTDVVTGIVAIAALVAAVKVVMVGSRMLLRNIRG